MRKINFAVLCILLLCSCHRREAQQNSSSDTVQPTPVVVSVIDSVSDKTETQPEYAVHRDTAMRTDSRIFRRKREVVYNADQLVGEWRRGNEHEVYRTDGTGIRWNTDDDVSRSEAQAFTWKMADNLLEVKYPISRVAL